VTTHAIAPSGGRSPFGWGRHRPPGTWPGSCRIICRPFSGHLLAELPPLAQARV